jgi:ribosomal-protein-alanine N-acetyltransferase
MKIIKYFHSINAFETQRLSAIRIEAQDSEILLQMHTHPQVMATLGGLRSPQQSADNLMWNLEQWTKNGFGLWMEITLNYRMCFIE